MLHSLQRFGFYAVFHRAAFVDFRFIFFIFVLFAGAKHLVDEMTIVE